MNDHNHGNSADDIDCLQAIEQMYAYLDGELEAGPKRKFEEHLQHCRSCFSRQELETELSSRLKQEADQEVPKALQDRLKKIIDNF